MGHCKKMTDVKKRDEPESSSAAELQDDANNNKSRAPAPSKDEIAESSEKQESELHVSHDDVQEKASAAELDDGASRSSDNKSLESASAASSQVMGSQSQSQSQKSQKMQLLDGMWSRCVVVTILDDELRQLISGHVDESTMQEKRSMRRRMCLGKSL